MREICIRDRCAVVHVSSLGFTFLIFNYLLRAGGYLLPTFWMQELYFMSCFKPLQAFQSLRPKSNGKALIFFDKPRFTICKDIQIPCGRCIGCRLERSRQWAVRCEKEIQSYEQRGLPSCFITLTLMKMSFESVQILCLLTNVILLFMKRLRKHLVQDLF